MTVEREGRCAPPPELDAVMADLFQAPDMQMMHLFGSLQKTAHLMSYVLGEYREEGALSPARLRLLLRLEVDRRLGHDAGISPTELSRFLRVGRNTVSALLSALEEQGLIARELHPTDRRQFLIRITDEGRAVVQADAPRFGAFVAEVLSVLDADERATLLRLLDKLLASICDRAAEMGLELPPASVEET